uniref:Protein pet100 log mitochondrial n=1 Tax=Triatoma infestans TaxID=30076 RepID=A0A023F7B9_TRIIF
MGGWKLEVFKMGIYMAFPVALFHYFNQPQYFEEWVTKVKREIYPPDDPEKRELFQNTIRELQKRNDIKLLKALEAEANQ